MRAKIIVGTAKQNTILRGHPWIFPKAIVQSKGSLITGDLVDIYNEEHQFLGVGAYNEHSLYRVRVLALAHEKNMTNYEELIKTRLYQAQRLRQSLGLPNGQTNAYRLFNSEADGLSGLTIDRFNHHCVVSSSAYWVENNREIITQIIQTVLPQDEILWFSQAKPLSQDGWKGELTSEGNQSTHIVELGILFHIEFAKAQKTGLFIDQRENHRRIAELAKGKKVLDLYTYTGGFALHAAAAGAAMVIGVDSSEQAIRQARENAVLNQLTNIEFIEADARDYLSRSSEFDIIILDPPKLIPSQQHLHRAKNYYRFLHRQVFQVMKPGALLMTCNCSSALSAADFCALVSAQALAVGKQVRILGTYGPAACHPTLAAFPEGNYLTAILFAVV